MAELVTEYMGLALPSPLVLASCALSNRVENLEMAEGHGAGAVVLRSLFEEQLEAATSALEEELLRGAESNPEARTYFPPQRVGPHDYLSLVERAKRALEIPVIASLNCAAPGSWTEYARDIEQAGADALEVNLYAVEADPAVSGAEVEPRYLDIVAAVRQAVRIPHRREALAVLLLARELRRAARRARRERDRPLQPLPPAGHLARAHVGPVPP